MKDKAINVIYITSRGHSGSTLLAHLLGAHPSIVGVGEIKMLSQDKDERKLCSCHQLPPFQCPFWSSVQEHVVQRIGKHLHELDLEGDDPDTFFQDNSALFESISHVSGLRTIVDSSKSLPRAVSLCHAFGRSDSLRLRVLRLHRGPLGLVNSARKMGVDIRSASYNYVRMFFRTKKELSPFTSFFISYENLARNTVGQLRAVMRFVDVPFDAAQLRWRSGGHRDIHGNDMRFATSEKIRLDRKWVVELSWSEKLAICLWTISVRLRSPLLFRWMRDFVKRGDLGSLFDFSRLFSSSPKL